MPLTGLMTRLVAIALCVVVSALTVWAWNRVSRSRSWRWVVRGVLLLGSQLSAVILVLVLINDQGVFYTSWLELFGEQHSVRHAVAAPGLDDARVRDRLLRAHGRGVVVKLVIPGVNSGVGSFPALVYLPPQYAEPEYQQRSFPVVELVAGSPGTPQTWTDSLEVAAVLDGEMGAGRSLPFIAVMPSQDVAGSRDTQCVNVVGGPKVETYLSVDVRSAVVHAFRVNTNRSAWAIAGYSSGGFCASNLAMRHPDRFAVAASIAGYARPAHDAQTGDLFGHDATLRDLNTPLWRASHLPPPEIALLLVSTAQDTATARDAAALAAAARAPFAVSRLALRRGGHNFQVWHAELPVVFAWISAHLSAPLAPPPVIDGTPPTVVTS